ncbi:MAG TPA: hypothetical protein PK252_07980 [Bacteroidales bacterium]|nr:hypothetical protein [Bacteroidales bacterium]
MKKLFVFVGILLMCTSIFAQRKGFAIGARIEGDEPNNLGVSLRGKIHRAGMLEGIVHFYDGSVGATGLYERYINLSSSGTFDFVYGGGAHVEFTDDLGAGIAGIVGLCYTFKEIPVNISVDWKPVLDIVSDVHMRARLLGVSIRYTMK